MKLKVLKAVRLFSGAAFLALISAASPALSDAKSKDGEISKECRIKAKPYYTARAAYEKKAKAYWNKISRKKSLRRKKRSQKQTIIATDYVLTHPPAYKGPKKPKCLIKKKTKKTKRRTISRVSDYLASAKKLYKFEPAKVSELTFKRSYAKNALAAGLTAEQVVGVYALETGGLGPYNRQSGVFNVNRKCKIIKPRGRPISTALGYAQLLAANTAAVVTENSLAIVKKLKRRASRAEGKRKDELNWKAALVIRMTKDIKTGISKYKRRNNWREFVAFGKTKRGGAVHTLNLDPDIGPIIQVYKLKKIVDVARRKGFESISAAQLELMNLVGYGRGLEMMRPVAQTAATANFFSRRGYERNPVARNKTANGLLKSIGRIIKRQMKQCGSVEFEKAFADVQKK